MNEEALPPREFLGKDAGREVMIQSKPFARASDLTAWRQLIVLALVFAGTLVTASALRGSVWIVTMTPIVVGLFIRIFVLQHDCGHHSFFSSRRLNDAIGLILSLITSVPYEAWRTEHHWHHNHQGRISKRGVDMMNSPMMVSEIAEKPGEAKFRVNKVGALNLFLIGAYSLLVERKVPSGFFPFRETFLDPVRNKQEMLRGILFTLPVHIALQVGLALLLGWQVTAFVLLPAIIIGSGIGSLLFWVQHNFEHTYYDEREWNKADVAVHGSSYLDLHPVLAWFTGDIGLHHVHHLNPRIPNYRLEEARRTIPALASVEPLSKQDLERSFTHIFWDPSARRMKSPEELDEPIP